MSSFRRNLCTVGPQQHDAPRTLSLRNIFCFPSSPFLPSRNSVARESLWLLITKKSVSNENGTRKDRDVVQCDNPYLRVAVIGLPSRNWIREGGGGISSLNRKWQDKAIFRQSKRSKSNGHGLELSALGSCSGIVVKWHDKKKKKQNSSVALFCQDSFLFDN